MKKFLISLIILAAAMVSAALVYIHGFRFASSGQMEWVAQKQLSGPVEIPILLYHNIDGPGDFSVDLETIRSHFEFLRDRGIRVISLKELDDMLAHPEPLKERMTAITFDDGYPAMYTKLLPLVKEFGYPVTLFVYTDFINPGNIRALLNWNVLKEMDESLIDIQSHGIAHRDMTAVPSGPEGQAVLYQEIVLSKKMLEFYLNKKVDYFAFPYGRYSTELMELCRNAGYRRVFSTDYGNNIVSRDNFSLRRQHIRKRYSMEFFEKFMLKAE